MNPWLLLLYITSAAVVVFGGLVGAVCLIGAGPGPGEDHAPDFADEIRGCRINATPHHCDGDTHTFPPRPPDYPATPAERAFADAVENWMKEHAA